VDNNDIEALLAAAVAAYRQLPSQIAVGVAIEAVTGKAVVPLSGDKHDAVLLQDVGKAAVLLIANSKNKPIKTGRLNELGNAIESPLLDALLEVGVDASWPKRADGTGGRSGYPDIAINATGDRPTYLEAKVVGAGSEGSSFRSFYLSPSERPKVCLEARHLLLAFTHQRIADSEEGLEQYRLLDFKIVDLARVFGKIKFEYQSSNKDMYLGDAVVLKG
jgi:hypothetical protein